MPPPPPEGGGGPIVIGMDPPDGAEGVDRLLELRIGVDRPLSALSVSRSSVRLLSGPERRLLSIRFDPARSELIARDFHGHPLAPGVLYRVEVEGIRDLDGVPMAAPFRASFTTGSEEGTLPAAPDVGFGQVAPIFAERCASSSCHGGSRPALGLDLSSPEAIRATALGVPASQIAVAEDLAGAERPWGGISGLAIVDQTAGAGRPELSYLLYKVLGDPHIVGDPMPPLEEGGLSRAQILLLSDWIFAGASLR